MSKKTKLPNLQKGLTTLDTFAISNYVIIKDYHAVVAHGNMIVAIDLKTYFTSKSDNEDEIEEKIVLLEYLDGKLIGPSYWEELVNGDHIEVMDEDVLKLTSKGMEKELHYIAPEMEDDKTEEIYINGILKILQEVVVKETLKVHIENVQMSNLIKLSKMFGTSLNDDNIIIENLGLAESMRFTFDTNRHIFGILSNNYSINEELFVSAPMEAFVKENLLNK